MIRITIDIGDAKSQPSGEHASGSGSGLASMTVASGAPSQELAGDASAQPQAAAAGSTGGIDGGPAPSIVSSGSGSGASSTSVPIGMSAPANLGAVEGAQSAGPAPTFE